MFRHILLPTDGSIHSIKAAEKAIQIAKLSTNSEIEVIYVVDGNTSKQDVLRSWDSAGIRYSREKRLHATVNLANKAGVKYAIKILRGDPAKIILTYAKEKQIDLIVMGSRGLNSFQEMLLGSVSHRVTKYSQCPVMVVK
ncbi:universal stress protein (plasmid) [Metabacillus halosaccharovorans]|uniref:universal stress protein n=1 Tax=Bacillaceae TaxID=186817 RepID=UPI000C75FAB7|nr:MULTISPECIES: universal stress protein [Bacillaceae]MCM3443940.1 universal stress protein [Metabacillus halosaccharovorans]PLR67333.1 universal stress protein [Bacillus sp. UMB0893]PMC35006.1 universal stress protein [Bacillus sp. UMB0899]